MNQQGKQRLRKLGQQLADTGCRGLVVISGDRHFQQQTVADWCQLFPGNWLWVGDTVGAVEMSHLPPTAAREILGQQYYAVVFDADAGLNAEALAAVSGTLSAGGWLLMLLPDKNSWMTRLDQDSLRWADSGTPIATPNFMHYLNHCLSCWPVTEWQQGAAAKFADFSDFPKWYAGAEAEQQRLLPQLVNAEPGIYVVIAARGRGKSALAGQLARQNGRCLVTAPARRATEILADYAQPHFHYIAPDALIAEAQPPVFDWLIIDEAAAIPTPLLAQLVRRYPRTLLTTTIQGYEGTGRGFILRFCQRLPALQIFYLYEPLRWARGCPLEAFINQLFLFSELEPPASQPIAVAKPAKITALTATDWQQMTNRARQFYQLLERAHYRTTPLDLRRMMDGRKMQFWLSTLAEQVISAAWLLQEGGLDWLLTQAIWAGFRRPRGNLVAQSLAAHSAFPQAAQLRSLRISRLAVHEQYRRSGVGTRLVRQIIAAAEGQDFISVSFGFTETLLKFWQHCGFTLVRLGTQREASSGCYAAMAIYPLSRAGQQLTEAASQRWQKDWPWLHPIWFNVLAANRFAPLSDQVADQDDWQELVGFALAKRSLPASLPALGRIWQQHGAEGYPAIGELFCQQVCNLPLGRRQWLKRLREDVRQWLLYIAKQQPEVAQRVAEIDGLLQQAKLV